jgi:hypothetical protein
MMGCILFFLSGTSAFLDCSRRKDLPQVIGAVEREGDSWKEKGLTNSTLGQLRLSQGNADRMGILFKVPETRWSVQCILDEGRSAPIGFQHETDFLSLETVFGRTATLSPRNGLSLHGFHFTRPKCIFDLGPKVFHY